MGPTRMRPGVFVDGGNRLAARKTTRILQTMLITVCCLCVAAPALADWTINCTVSPAGGGTLTGDLSQTGPNPSDSTAVSLDSANAGYVFSNKWHQEKVVPADGFTGYWEDTTYWFGTVNHDDEYLITAVFYDQYDISIDDPTVNENAGSVDFTVTLSKAVAAGQTVTVNYTTADGTAAAGSDYTTTAGSIEISAGASTGTISVPIIDDSLPENAETFTVSLTGSPDDEAVGGEKTGYVTTITDASGSATINDAGPDAYQISINDPVAVSEGSDVVFNVTLDQVVLAGQTVTVNYATAGGTATEGSDYTAVSGTVTFGGGEDSKTVTVQTVNDGYPEDPEQFTVGLSVATSSYGGVNIADASGAGTINDTPDAYQISIDDQAATEGSDLVFNVTLSQPVLAGQTVTVNYATAGGTATEGSDYTAVSGTLTFSGTEDSKTVTVSTTDDGYPENAEGFTVGLSVATSSYGGVNIADASGAGTINDTPDAYQISIDDQAATEGSDLVFNVTLSQPVLAGQTVTVNYATAGGTATEGSDYTAVSGTLTFSGTEDSKTVTVSTTDDGYPENAEGFTVGLSGETSSYGAVSIADASGTGTINDTPDEYTVTLSGTPSGAEGTSLDFTVTLDKAVASGQTVTVAYTTADVTATSPGDYSGVSGGTVVYSAGQSGDKTITIGTTNDALPENTETFTLTLDSATESGPAHTVNIAGSPKTGTITDTGPDEYTVTLSGTPTETEGTNLSFSVSLDKAVASGQTVTVVYSTADGTANSPSDYSGVSGGTVVYSAGESGAKAITITTVDDALPENTETLTLALDSATETGGHTVNLSGGPQTGTITDTGPDEYTVTLSGTPTETEGTNLSFSVSLDKAVASGQTVTVVYSTADGTANSPSDYSGVSGRSRWCTRRASRGPRRSRSRRSTTRFPRTPSTLTLCAGQRDGDRRSHGEPVRRSSDAARSRTRARTSTR